MSNFPRPNKYTDKLKGAKSKEDQIIDLIAQISTMPPGPKKANLEWQLKQLLEPKAPPPSGVEGFK